MPEIKPGPLDWHTIFLPISFKELHDRLTLEFQGAPNCCSYAASDQNTDAVVAILNYSIHNSHWPRILQVFFCGPNLSVDTFLLLLTIPMIILSPKKINFNWGRKWSFYNSLFGLAVALS